jgi:hypothetical protein
MPYKYVKSLDMPARYACSVWDQYSNDFIVGSLDPYLAGSMALYNICEMDNAYLFDHAKGHTLPRDKDTIRELGDTIRLMISNIE